MSPLMGRGYSSEAYGSLIYSPDAVIHSPAEMIAARPTTVTQIAVATRLRPEDAKAVLGIVERDALDKARQYFLGR